MTPRFVNPHLVTQPVEFVSRAALDAPFDDDMDVDVNNGWMIMQLEKLVTRSIDPAISSIQGEDDAARTRRSKRRRLGYDEEEDASLPVVSPGMSLLYAFQTSSRRQYHIHS